MSPKTYNMCKRIELQENPIAYREFLCITRGMLSIQHTDTLNIATETFSVGEEPAIKLIHFEICNDQQQLSTLGPKNIGTNLQEH